MIQNSVNNEEVPMEFPNMNHLFQDCETGVMSEYAKIEQTFSPIALKEITDWVTAIVKNH